MRPQLTDALRFEMAKRYHTSRKYDRPRTSHHASDAAACLRRLYYAWEDAPIDNPRGTAMAMPMGVAVETFAELVLTGTFEDVERGVWMAPVEVGQKQLRGQIDFVVGMLKEDWQRFFPQYPFSRVPVEVKSLNSNRYAAATLRGPSQTHQSQLNVYVGARQAPFGLMMYVQREANDDIPFTLWSCPFNKARYDGTLKRLAKLEQYQDLNVPPPPMCEQDRLDPWCPWKNIRCPHDGGWPAKACPQCGEAVTDLSLHADCVFGKPGGV